MNNEDKEKIQYLRQKTRFGVMECFQALKACNFSVEEALAALKEKSDAFVVKNEAKTSSGLILGHFSPEDNQAAMVELRCESDFLAKTADFQKFSATVLDYVVEHQLENLDVFHVKCGEDLELNNIRKELMRQTGENIQTKRVSYFSGKDHFIGMYIHRGYIGCLVKLVGGNSALAEEIALQIVVDYPVIAPLLMEVKDKNYMEVLKAIDMEKKTSQLYAKLVDISVFSLREYS